MKNLLNHFLVMLMFFNVAEAQDKTAITKAEDLPKHSYQLKTKDAETLINSKENILELATLVKKDLLADLEKYDIKENATLRSYYGTLMTISILEGDYKKAQGYIQKARTLADKKSEGITLGLESEVFMNAYEQSNTMDASKLSPQITQLLEAQLKPSDFSMIQEDIEANKGRTEIFSKNLLVGIVQSQVQPALDNNKGKVPGDLVTELVDLYYALNYYVPYKEAFYEGYASYLDKNAVHVEKVDIWQERDAVINEDPKYAPVLIGIWDTGVDMPVLPMKKQWTNPNEKFDGKDTDGNGFIDDVYGISYDLDGLKDPNYLDPTAVNLPDIKKYQNYLKGYMDVRANINSKEASSLKKYLSELQTEEVNDFIEMLNLYANYAHGTHVAGIAEDGNDMARIMLVRFTADYKNIPSPPTDETTANYVTYFSEVVNYLSENKVRVVNMSWGDAYEYTLANLELNGIGKDDEERKALAKKYFDQLYNAFKKSIQSVPEILFICAAGNANNDVDFMADYPSSINLPNLITVGAVDIEGKKTSFTTEGKSVDVYANGYEVESYVPGGDRLAFSGTSMASPNAANLAAKILAVNPNLKPEEVIDIMIKTATRSEEDEKVLLIHPKNAVQMALK